MSSKPKKTLSEEQLKKMKEGRIKAQEKRKKEREIARKQAKDLNEAKKSKDKERLLQLEMEALQQQQDRIDNLKLQVERKKQVKSKLKQIKETEEKPAEQVYETPLEEEQTEEVEEVEEALHNVEEKIIEQIENKDTDPRDYVPNDNEYAEVFKKEANKMRKNIPVDSRQYYDQAVKKFDFTLSLDDNIKSMIDFCKSVVVDNTKIANNIRTKLIEKEQQKELVQKSVAEKVTEQSVDSKIYKLMKLK